MRCVTAAELAELADRQAEGDSLAAKHSAALYLTLLILVVVAIGESSVILLALSLHRH